MKRVLLILLATIFVTSMLFMGIGCKEESVASDEIVGKHFEGVDVVFFAGGPAGCPFASIVARGAEEAGVDLGCSVKIIYSDWNPEKMISQFKEAIGMKPDGIAVMGHPGQDPYWPLIDDAEEQGIIITTQNVDLPDIEEKYKSSGFGYSGASLYGAGYLLGAEAFKRSGLKAGDKALVYGFLYEETRGLRTEGAIAALEDAGMVVDYLDCTPEVNADISLGSPIISGYVTSNPDLKLLLVDILSHACEIYLKAAGKGPDDIYAAGFDISPAVIEAIKNGYADLSLDQQPYLQGYLPVLQICLTKTYGFTGMHVDTGSGFLDKDNVDLIAPLAEKGYR